MRRGTADSLYFVDSDHLGSILALMRNNGTTAAEYSYDEWGRRRNPSDLNDYINIPNLGFIDRGYTGHEHYDPSNLIDMNGRVYDPVIGRFLSPDPFIQLSYFTQSFNNFSYCFNNPLKFSDPTGFNVYGKNGEKYLKTDYGTIGYESNQQQLEELFNGLSYLVDSYDKDKRSSPTGGGENNSVGLKMINGEWYWNGRRISDLEASMLMNTVQEKDLISGEVDVLQFMDPHSQRALINIDKVIAFIIKNAQPDYTHWCAKYINDGYTEGGGAKYRVTAGFAKDFGPTMEDYGYHILETSYENYTPMKGDIAIFGPSSQGQFNHIQIYSGSDWVSDTIQIRDGFWVYGKDSKASYTIYRWY
jgi:RHS repeat-associated protein